MAFKLNKTEETQLDELRKKLDAQYTTVEATLDTYNEELNILQASVKEELENYNEALSELRSFVENIAADRRNEYEDKSESWQEGENGQAADEWISTWENADLENVTLDFPQDLNIEFENHTETDLPTEP